MEVRMHTMRHVVSIPLMLLHLLIVSGCGSYQLVRSAEELPKNAIRVTTVYGQVYTFEDWSRNAQGDLLGVGWLGETLREGPPREHVLKKGMIEKIEYWEPSGWKTMVFILCAILVLAFLALATMDMDFSEIYGTLAGNTILE